MRTHLAISLAVLLSAAACSSVTTAATTTDAWGTGSPALQWGPAPAVFPAGAQMAVLDGNPGAAQSFTVRLRFPDGYKIPPHTHPTAENVTVISGKFLAGMGTTFVESGMQAFAPGDFASIPAEHAHYAMARGQTIVQVHAMGPFALTYVNAADAPKAR